MAENYPSLLAEVEIQDSAYKLTITGPIIISDSTGYITKTIILGLIPSLNLSKPHYYTNLLSQCLQYGIGIST